jgi:hypothetical protein
MWAGPAVETVEPNRNSRQRRTRGRRGVRGAGCVAGPVHDLQFARALVRSTGGVSRGGSLAGASAGQLLMTAPGIRVANDELVTAREVMRDLPALWSARGPRR